MIYLRQMYVEIVKEVKFSLLNFQFDLMPKISILVTAFFIVIFQ